MVSILIRVWQIIIGAIRKLYFDLDWNLKNHYNDMVHQAQGPKLLTLHSYSIFWPKFTIVISSNNNSRIRTYNKKNQK